MLGHISLSLCLSASLSSLCPLTADIIPLCLSRQRYQRIKGSQQIAKRLKAFKTGAEDNVLLLPVKSAGKGLNLCEAEHVLFAEPLLDRALEAQAIGRVHRMGQERRTFVHRFAVDGTVEERINNWRKGGVSGDA